MLDADRAKIIVDVKAAETIAAGGEVYLIDQYYYDFKTSVLEIPRYGWKVKQLENGMATIEYQRRNLKLLMSLTVDCQYLKREA